MTKIRGKTVICKCAVCKEEFIARVADRNRGWARCCSKRCAAIKSNKETGKYDRYLASLYKEDDYYDDSHLFGDE